MKLSIIAMIFIPLISGSLLAGTYSGGDGTSGDPYQIANLTDLQELQNTSGDWYAYFIQTANIDASATSEWDNGAGFSPIGSESTNFTGEYNGSGYTISNLYINRSSNNYIGLFGECIGATISNLGVTSADISGNAYTGALAGCAGSISMSSCYSSGIIYSSNYYIGGLIGIMLYGTVRACYSSADVVGNSDVGGLIGGCLSSCSIINCYAKGHVNGSNSGGLVGYIADSQIIDCYSIGNVYGPGAGGLAAYGSGTTYPNCFWNTETSQQFSSIGGTGKTTLQMQNLATYTDTTTDGLTTAWDFENNPFDDSADNNYWDFDNVNYTINEGYPFLSWENGDEIALPVELVSFAGSFEQNLVTLNWTTASEVNAVGFIIDRKSSQETNWQQIASYRTNNELVCLNNQIGNAEYSYTDNTAQPDETYTFRLSDVDVQGNVTALQEIEVTTTDVVMQEDGLIPKTKELLSAYPNPFNPTTTIKFALSESQDVCLRVYDVTGQQVAELVNKPMNAGFHQVVWNAGKISSGVYFIRIKTKTFQAIEKCLLVK